MALIEYQAFVDETGDRGHSPTSSPFFGFAAVVIRRSNMPQLHATKASINAALVRQPGHELHWSANLKKHEQRIEAADQLGRLPVRIVTVTMEKAAAPAHAHLLQNRDGMYNFLARLLLERISWVVDDAGGEASVMFASVSGMPKHILRNYVSLLRSSIPTKIRWQAIRPKIHLEQARRFDGLQMADIAAGALDRAIRPSSQPPHRIEPAYLQALSRVLYRGNTNKLASYGMKALASPGFWQQYPWWNALATKP